MTEQYIFSPQGNLFYPVSLRDDYESAGGWPADGVDISYELYLEFIAQPPTGMVRGVAGGLPVWVAAPPLSSDERAASAQAKKAALRLTADSAIAPLQDAVDLDDATDEEVTQLMAWKQYRVALNRVDITADDIVWPELPQT